MCLLIDHAISRNSAEVNDIKFQMNLLVHVFPVSKHPNDCAGAGVGDGIYSAESPPISVPPSHCFCV